MRKAFISLDFELSGSHLKQVDISPSNRGVGGGGGEEKAWAGSTKFNGQKFSARGSRGRMGDT